MKNKKIISLLASTAIATVVSTSAYSQISITGYVETSYMTGSAEVGSTAANAIVNTTKQLGIIIPWHFRNSIINSAEFYLSKGGSLLVPLPFPEIVS